MDLKIQAPNTISFDTQLNLCKEYISKNQTRIPPDPNEMFDFESYSINGTGKNPTKISVGSRNFWVLCRKTPTQYVFKLWHAS